MRSNLMSSRFVVVGVLAVVGLFAVSEVKGASGKRWIHPLCKPLEITKNGRVFKRVPGGDRHDVEFTCVDGSAERDTDYYYVHVLQADGEQAWSSPVWVNRP